MTCEDFKQTVTTQVVAEMLPSSIVALAVHRRRCQTCTAWMLAAVEAEAERNNHATMSVEREMQLQQRAREVKARVDADPELRPMVEAEYLK